MTKEMVCRKCKGITTSEICDKCGSSDLSPDWIGVVLVTDPDNSKITHSLGITKKGKFAIKVT